MSTGGRGDRPGETARWSPAELAAHLGTDLDRGLDPAEADARLRTHGFNELPAPRDRPLPLRVLDKLREPMALLLLGAATVSAVALEERLEAAAILVIVVVNAVIALVQEGRGRRALAALERLQQAQATVVRAGSVSRLDARVLVPGDLVRIEAGDRVPADVRLTASAVLRTDESMLTGESVPVDKDAAAPSGDATLFDRPAMLFGGTYVTKGTGQGLVAATGPDSALGRIAAGLHGPTPPTPLQRELAGLTARLGIAAVVIAGAVLLLTLARAGLSAEALERAFLSSVALAVAAVPEGLATVTLVGLAVGVRRMAKQRALIRRLPAVETLGSATVIVADKTGTVTVNRLRVAEVAGPDGRFRPLADCPGGSAEVIHRVGVLCNDASLEPPRGDPLEVALLEAAGRRTVRRLRDEYPRVGGAPFDPARRRMSTVHGTDGGYLLLVKGAAEAVLPATAGVLDRGESARPLTGGERTALLAAAEKAAERGLRVLALAQRALPAPPEDAERDERDLLLVGFVGLSDPVRPEAATAVADVVAAGLRLVMATGDHRATASAIATQIGLPADATTTGDELRRSGMPDDPASVAVYARLDPDQKVELVEALRRRGEVVAMTGDGVNDAPALHRADIGVALGARGSDVAREAADMVIGDDDLATIVAAVREGRGVYDNIRKVVDYLVAGNLSEIGVVVGALVLFPQLGVPLLPLQLLWVNLLTDGMPALALGVDRHDPSLMRQPPRSKDTHLLDRRRIVQLAGRGAAMATACLATLPLTLLAWGHEPERARTVLLTTLVTVHLLYAFVARLPATWTAPAGLRARGMSGWLVAALVVGLGLQALVVTWPPAREVFGTVPLSLGDWGLTVGAAVAGVAGSAAVRWRGARQPL
jgi:P-type Ca2+ transporter type 2C